MLKKRRGGQLIEVHPDVVAYTKKKREERKRNKPRQEALVDLFPETGVEDMSAVPSIRPLAASRIAK